MTILPPAVIVRGPADVAAALAPGRPVTLLSAPGAAAFAGPLWWAALAARARGLARAPVADVFDVNGSAGLALAALRCGCADVALTPGPAWAAVAAVAAALSARLHDAPPAALDLQRFDAVQRLVPWLDRDGTAMLS